MQSHRLPTGVTLWVTKSDQPVAKRSGDGGGDLESDVDFILTNAPRLMIVAAATAISFALWDGVAPAAS
jgi:hypothetical protein